MQELWQAELSSSTFAFWHWYLCLPHFLQFELLVLNRSHQKVVKNMLNSCQNLMKNTVGRSSLKFWVTCCFDLHWPVTNLLLCKWIIPTTCKFTRNIKVPSSILSRNRCYGLRPLWQPWSNPSICWLCTLSLRCVHTCQPTVVCFALLLPHTVVRKLSLFHSTGGPPQQGPPGSGPMSGPPGGALGGPMRGPPPRPPMGGMPPGGMYYINDHFFSLCAL